MIFQSRVRNFFITAIEQYLMASRWVLAILCIGLSIGLICYCFKFCEDLIAMVSQFRVLTTEMMMLALLGLVDTVMVANLVVMVNIGGYSIFIKEIDAKEIKNRPRFMNNITSSTLKIKMGSSLIGVSSIHLLKLFIEAASSSNAERAMHPPSWYFLSMVIVIHLVFVVSTVALAIIDRSHSHAPAPADAH